MRIRWTQRAVHDLTSICDYIQENNGAKAARSVAVRIYEGIARVGDFPHSGRVGRKEGTREVTFP